MFKPSITTWTRLEPNPVGEDMRPSLEACVYDPAWMIARQWQIGEFRGEDAGTPIDVSLEVHAMPVVGFKANNEPAVYSPGLPVEYLAGSEPKNGVLPFEAAEAGMELINLLMENNVSNQVVNSIVRSYPFKTNKGLVADQAGENFLQLLSAVAGGEYGLPDPFTKAEPGSKTLEELLRDTAKNQTPSPLLGIPASEAPQFVKSASDWVEFIDLFIQYSSQQGYSWHNERMEHSFKLEARNISNTSVVVLKAAEWDGTKLDWYSLDVDTNSPPLTTGAVEIPLLPGLKNDHTTSHQGLPTLLTYQGMPNLRWWEFEDARVNFAQIDYDKNDLARMLVTEFACAYGDDWYLVPMSLPVGAIHTVKNFKITDNFGEVKEIYPVDYSLNTNDKESWCLFRQSQIDNQKLPCAGLLLYPAAYLSKSGFIEQISFFRDELANMAWAVEAQVESSDGRVFNRQRNYTPRSNNAYSYEKEQYEYVLVSEIPEHWFPLVSKAPATPTSPPPAIFEMLLANPHAKPLGRVLSQKSDIWQEEIPFEGSEVTRQYLLSRAADGKVLLWKGRQKRTGRGEGSSGLQFDRAEASHAE